MRRRAVLATLSRMRRHELEAEAVELGRIGAQIAALEAERDALAERVTERGDGSIEEARVVGAFVRALVAEIRLVETRIEALRADQAARQEAVAAQFGELKRADLMLERHDRDAGLAADRREAREIEDACRALDH